MIYSEDVDTSNLYNYHVASIEPKLKRMLELSKIIFSDNSLLSLRPWF